ncbi:MAG: cupredoxin domain-containing protein, partial [Actinomycetota bacterium]|nr:cupredoxin domain-containing protein [Actinomycetota bacterium]
MSKDDRSIVSWFAFAAAIAALFVAILGVQNDGGSESAGGASGSGGGEKSSITITMYDNFSFSPSTVTVPTAGATITLVNDGSVAHNMEIAEFGLTSPVVQGKETIEWEIGPLDAGSYEFTCPQPGHAGAGMKGTLVVSDTASGGSGEDPMLNGGEGGEMTASQMDALMMKVAQQFPAVTEGKGG